MCWRAPGQEKDNLPCWKHELPQHSSRPGEVCTLPGQRPSNACTSPWLAGIRKGRAVFCASGLTRVSPPLHLEGHFQLTEA